MADKVDKFAELTTKVNKAGLSDFIALYLQKSQKDWCNLLQNIVYLDLEMRETKNEYHHVKRVCILWQNFAKNVHCWKICFQKLFWVALDVCVGKNQLGGDKRDKIANIGAVECRTCHRKLSTKRLSTKKTAMKKSNI